MAKGQKRSNRETKKPKQVKPASPVSKPSGLVASMLEFVSKVMLSGPDDERGS